MKKDQRRTWATAGFDGLVNMPIWVSGYDGNQIVGQFDTELSGVATNRDRSHRYLGEPDFGYQILDDKTNSSCVMARQGSATAFIGRLLQTKTLSRFS
ncbi:hypothetical protein THTE_2717 [Thermogutta terrifontis]|uniref:Uncharacterized protein n=1 Tax=Thermogutta terrifontis TaxID=1331910 RepID=A0A286RH86_9BACT|nr:hypothetical protein [Thermogutta terrifontis]ASV75319.1 hypothetical protein THTE_2717 [Thermogutta terrifontis]